LRVGCKAACSCDEALTGHGIRVPKELDTDDLACGLIERTPHFGGVVATMEGPEAIATSDELPFLVTCGDRSLRRRCDIHSPH
jgi:hypothetical protein